MAIEKIYLLHSEFRSIGNGKGVTLAEFTLS